MLASAIVVFREVLEAALIMGIVLAASRGARGREFWVALGTAGGVAGALITAFFADQLSEAMQGIGQEVFNAGVLLAAVIMLGWHNVWMSSHGRQMARDMTTAGQEVRYGDRSLFSLGIVVGLAVLREGSEVVLFLYGMAAGTGSWATIIPGGAIGLGLGVLVGGALYFGLLRIPTKHLFRVTSWMILLLAAGMASQAAHFLVQADILPALGGGLWDSSAILSERSILGQTLHTLVGYDARPDGIQLVVYGLTLAVIGGLMILFRQQNGKNDNGPAVLSALIIAGLVVGAALVFLPAGAQATEKVYSPIVEQGELEVEMRGHFDVNDDVPGSTGQKHRIEVGYGFTPHWFSSVFVELAKDPGGALRDEAVAWENVIQLWEQGERWVDMGLYLEYEASTRRANADKLEGKLLLEKSVGRFTHTLNLIFEKELGDKATEGTEMGYAWRTKYRWRPELEFALEAFGDFGEIRDLGPWSHQKHNIGPVIMGKLPAGRAMHIKYELGYLVGLTDASVNGRLKWLVELEVPL